MESALRSGRRRFRIRPIQPPIVLRLDEIRAGDTALAGGKGANLGELASKGFPVPAGFVVTTIACREAFGAESVRQEIEALERGAKAGRIRDALLSSEIPRETACVILDAHQRLTAGREIVCAVRSSATAEDLAGASFAGQHGTYYYVGRERLLEMIVRCWASLWSDGAVEYRASRGIAHAGVAMAVVVQEMIPSEVAGTAFTVNPVSGARDEVVIEASWGMGAAIVDGRVTPDQFVVGRDSRESRRKRIAEKRFMIRAHLVEGEEERLVPVPDDLRCTPTLRDDDVAAVAGWALRCEEHFGAPQDVEFAFSGGRFHLLQSRPVTTLAAPQETKIRGRWVLFKALAENFTDPLTPLTASLLSPVVPPGLKIIDGRPYTDLDALRPLIPFRLTDEQVVEMMYLRDLPPLRVSLLRLPVAIGALIAGNVALAVLYARTRDMPDDFMQGYREHCRRVLDDERLDPMNAFIRLWLVPGLFGPIGRNVLAINGTITRIGLWMGVLRLMVRRWFIPLPSQALALLCSGTQGVLSTMMGREIEALAGVARRSAEVTGILTESAPADALARLRAEPAAAEFVAALDRFLAVHGHRAIREFELRSPRWEENPAPVLSMIRSRAAAPAGAGEARHDAVDARAELEIVLRTALEHRPLEWPLRLRWRMLHAVARRIRYYLKLRENSRFYHIMGLGTLRKKILRIEAGLLRDGRLKCRDDIFFLRVDELQALREGKLDWRTIDDLVRERRLEHIRLTKTPPRRTIGIEIREPEGPPGGECLTGQGASPGRYTGVARVILDPAVDATLEMGEVLVAPYTDPAWTPLFLTAGAAVVEVGSYLSHAGTVAREYRMPCVVDVAHCTRTIRNGMRVEVDGDRGTVRILEEATP